MSKSFDITGGYISPCHPWYLYQKLPEESCPASTRNHLVKLALEDDPVWMLDTYMSSTPTFESNDLVLKAFRKRVDE
jgi:hypothetical protein